MQRIFVTGTDTNAGKTVASAIIVTALNADYWKPVQAGDLENTDTHKVAHWSPEGSICWPERYRLTQPASPHISAEWDGIRISLTDFEMPDTNNNLVIEGAGGLLAPLNDIDSVVDLITHLNCEVVLVSRHYLGSINHTLLSAHLLQTRNIPVKGIIFNGTPIPGTEEIILARTGFRFLGRIEPETNINKKAIEKYALQFRDKLL